MKTPRGCTGILILVTAIAALGGGMQRRAEGQVATPKYVVLSPTQVIFRTVCGKDDTALIQVGGALASGRVVPVYDSDGKNHWTIIDLITGGAVSALQSDKKYTFTISGSANKPEPNCYLNIPIQIDTAPTVHPLSSGAGARSLTLSSNVALTRAGKSTPFETIPQKSATGKPAVVFPPIQAPGVEIRGETFPTKDVVLQPYLDGLKIDNPNAIGKISATLEAVTPLRTGSAGKPKDVILPGLGNVLGAQPVFGSANLAASKAPATEDLAWLWINGTVTAGTGTAPAWLLDAKFQPPSTQANGTILWTWVCATANIGNNKINGQAAKDVIDVSGPSVTLFADGKEVGKALSLSPTYETNRAGSHRNLNAVGDSVFSWGILNKTQTVRAAETYFAKREKDPTKTLTMPAQGKFPDGFPTTGWSLKPHLGFEAGGALATTTVKNPKNNATIGILPTYSIARFVPQIDGLYQYRNFSLESYVTGRYLFTTEHTAVSNKAGIPYLETVSGWKAVNVLTFIYAPGSSPHLKFNVAYTDGFSAPTYQRANGVKIGLAIAY